MIIKYYQNINTGRPGGGRPGGHYLLKCDNCGKEFKRCASDVKKRKKHYCNKKCFHKSEIGKTINDKQREGLRLGGGSGDKNGNWSGGRHFDSEGYIFICSNTHPFKSKRNVVSEHRLVMEKYFGRYLTPEEVVHHINGDHSDNRIENLMLFANKSEHIKYHHKLKKAIYNSMD